MIILFVLFLLIKLIIGIPSNSYYLIDIDTNLLLNNSYCSNILISKNFYRIPNQCHKHLLCNAYHCDDKSFRCVKIRDTLCCLYKYLQKSCQKEILKDQFRSIYFHISIQHGYCEINLERIEQNDHSYCLANHLETTTTTTTSRSRSLPKHFHRYRTHLSNIHYLPHATTNTSSKTSFIYINFIVLLLLSILL
jgi:hypothetical protein